MRKPGQTIGTSPIHTADDLIDMMRRRARLLILVCGAGFLFSLLLALSQKHMYQSTEMIALTRPVSVNDLANASDASHRFSLIRQHLLSRASLIEIIDRFNLYIEYPDLKPGEMVERLRHAVRIKAGASKRQGPDGATISVLSVTAEMPIALQAQQVAHEISRRLIDLNTRFRVEKAHETLAFFTAQQDDLATRIRALDLQIAGFSRENDPRLSDTPPELAISERQLAQLRDEMAVISTHRTQAEIVIRMENQGLAERLNVIDPAALPDGPMASNRKWVALTGGALSVLLAFVLAFMQELRNPVIRTAAQMQRETGFIPMVSIPYLDPAPPKVTLWRRFLTWMDGPDPTDVEAS